MESKKGFWRGFFTALLGVLLIDIVLGFSIYVFAWLQKPIILVIIHFINIFVFLPALFILGFAGKEKGVFSVCKRLIIMGIIVIAFIIIFPLVTKIN